MKHVSTFDMITLDGRLIKPFSNFDLLLNLPNPSSSNWGYKEFLSDTDIIIMDEKDYFDIVDMDIKWPYAGKSTYIVTEQQANPLIDSNMGVISPNDLIPEIGKLKATGNIWLLGENTKYHAFKNNMVDVMYTVIIPLHVSGDQPVAISSLPPNRWNIAGHEVYDNGVIRIVYEKHQP